MAKMMRKLAAGLLACALSGMLPAQAGPMAGLWKTFSDRSGELESLVRIVDNLGHLEGRIEKIFSPPAPTPNPLCDLCHGDNKDKPVVGMVILHALVSAIDPQRADGDILDPDDGKVYKLKLHTLEGGDKLEVRGFLGISLLGRTEIWLRQE